MLDEPRRYGELRRLMPEITEKMPIQELRDLETDGVVARTVHQTVPPRVDYSLTQQGQRVRPVFAELLGWGIQYLGRGQQVGIMVSYQWSAAPYYSSRMINH